MATECDIEGRPSSAYEAAGCKFTSLLRDLAMEHGRIKMENASLLAKLEHGLGGHVQRSSLTSKPVQFSHEEGIEDERCDVINFKTVLSDEDSVRKSVPPGSEETTAPEISAVAPSPSQHSPTMSKSRTSRSSRSPSGSRLKSSSTVRQADEVKLQYLWEQPAESLQRGMSTQNRSLSVLSISFKHNSLSEKIPRGGDVMRSQGFMQSFIFGPYDFSRMLWDLISIVVLSIDVVMVPLVAFDLPEVPSLKVLNLTCTAFWSCDMLASCLTGFYLDQGRIEMRPKRVFMHYVRGWFLFDLLVVTIDWLLLLLTSGLADFVGLLRMTKMVRMGRLLRAIRLVRLLRAVKMPALLSEVTEHISFHETDGMLVAFRVLKSLITIGVANHFLACGWYAIGKESTPSWITQLDNDGRDLAFKYASALHWSLTQFTPASMEIFPRGLAERVYAICVLLLALVVFSSFVSSITNSMNHLRLTNQASWKQRRNLKRFMQENRLSLDLTNRIIVFARHLHVQTKARVHERDIEVFKVLPEVLRLQLHWEVYVPMVSGHPFLFHCIDGFEYFVLELCNSSMQETSLLTGQELFSRDQEANSMYFALSGSLEYCAGHTDIPVGAVNQDEWCSEVAIWLLWTHEGQLAALTQSELIALDAHVFRKLVAKDAPLFEVCKTYASSFRDHVLGLSKETPAELCSNHDVALEMSQRAFAPVIERQREMERSLSKSSGTWSFFQISPNILSLHGRSNTH